MLKKTQEMAGRNTIFQVDSLDSAGELRTDKPVFVTTMPNIFRIIDGELKSPLLSERDVENLLKIWKHQGKFAAYFSWTFIVTAIMIALMPIIVDVGLTSTEMMIILGSINGGLFVLAFNELFTFSSKSKKLGNELWNNSIHIKIPKTLRKKSFLKTLKLWSGPLAASVVSEGIDVFGSDELKIGHTSFEIGNEVINIIKKA